MRARWQVTLMLAVALLATRPAVSQFSETPEPAFTPPGQAIPIGAGGGGGGVQISPSPTISLSPPAVAVPLSKGSVTATPTSSPFFNPLPTAPTAPPGQALQPMPGPTTQGAPLSKLPATTGASSGGGAPAGGGTPLGTSAGGTFVGGSEPQEAVQSGWRSTDDQGKSTDPGPTPGQQAIVNLEPPPGWFEQHGWSLLDAVVLVALASVAWFWLRRHGRILKFRKRV